MPYSLIVAQLSVFDRNMVTFSLSFCIHILSTVFVCIVSSNPEEILAIEFTLCTNGLSLAANTNVFVGILKLIHDPLKAFFEFPQYKDLSYITMKQDG